VKYSKLIVVAGLMAAAGAAQAGGIGVRAGTTGLGVDYGFDIMPTLGGRIGLSGMNIDTDYDTSDVRYDGKAKLVNLNLFLDWSPLGPFRITGGFIANDNKVDVVGSPSSATGAAIVPPGSTLNGQIKSDRSFAPYLGVGYGNVWTKGVNFYFDLGIMFHGSPQVSLSCQSPNPATCAAVAPQVEAERQRLQSEVDKYKYFPVANIGLTIGW
jgi:hypothetical protein